MGRNFEDPDKFKIPEQSESDREKTFKEYMGNLKLSPDDFKKKILDVGSSDGAFAKWARDHHVSDSIYNIDSNFKAEPRGKSVVGKAQSLPFKNEEFDIVISNASIPNLLYAEYDLEKASDESIEEMLRVLKAGGEIRFAPIIEHQKEDRRKVLGDKVNKKLSFLQEAGQIVVQKEFLGLGKYEEGKLRKYLYKIKKLS